MRIWSIHPQYLDTKGLVALWREALLAQAVLDGKTKGYRNHPQLIRFRQHSDPLAAIGSYLAIVHSEAVRRDYNFDHAKIIQKASTRTKILVTSTQLEYEFLHLKKKLRLRAREQYNVIASIKKPEIHPLFKKIAGPIEPWEIV